MAGFMLIFWYKKVAMRVIGSIQFFAEVFDGFFQTDFQRYTRLPIEHIFRSCDVWFAALWIIFYGWHGLDLTSFTANQIAYDNSKFCKGKYQLDGLKFIFVDRYDACDCNWPVSANANIYVCI